MPPLRKVIPTESQTSQKIQPKGSGKGNTQAESQSCPQMSDAVYHLIEPFQTLLQSTEVPGGKLLPGIFSRQERSTENIPVPRGRTASSSPPSSSLLKHHICLIIYILQNTSTYTIWLGFEHLGC